MSCQRHHSVLHIGRGFAVASYVQPVPAVAEGDPGVEPEAEADDHETISVSGNMSGSEGRAGGTVSLGTHHTSYADLPQASKTLDALLYNIVRMSIKRSKQAVLKCATFPSYVRAVIVLVKHMDISGLRRISAAFSKLDLLTYSGGTLQFQSDFLASKREPDTCTLLRRHTKAGVG